MILVCMDASDAWREHVNHIVMRCRNVATVNVLLTYGSVEDVPDYDVTDSIFRHLVNIEMGIRRSRHPSDNLQRLVRRFVTGSEKTVVVLQGGCSLHDDFARTILEVQQRIPDGAIVSCPTSHITGVAQFPTLRLRSNGSVARDASKPIHTDSLTHNVELVPSVVWCPEMTISNGLLLKRWSKTTSNSFLEHVHRIPEVSHLVPSHPLLAHNARVEDDILDFDEGRDGSTICDAERVGITSASSSNERLVKYGTLFRARVAIESVRD
tara:strand:- start:17842 stop:18642 length:801 start_codon:yes stop_codon:yes gene_type:complete